MSRNKQHQQPRIRESYLILGCFSSKVAAAAGCYDLLVYRYVLSCVLFVLACEGNRTFLDASPADTPSPDAADAHVGATDAAPLADAPSEDGASLDHPPSVAAPPTPIPPATIGTLSVAIRTGSSRTADTDSPQALCLRDDQCFPLDLRDVDDFREGQVDVYHFENVNLERALVDQVTLRTLSDPATNDDRWTPECLDLRFDGEPVYCNDELDMHIGTGGSSGEVIAWTDPSGLHSTCETCQDSTLTHGPLQGAPGTNTLRVWVRSDATRLLGLRLGLSADLGGAPVSAWAYPRPEEDFTAILEASGLRAETTYYYRVEVDGEPASEIREIRTAPTESATSVRIGFGSCTKERTQPIFGPILADSPDLFLFVGDNHYGNSPYLDAHRWHYRWQRSLAERAELMARVPTLATWDDHDFVGNNTDATCAGVDDALRGFAENWANGPRPTTRGVFHQHRHGPVEVFMLDCRTHRPDAGDSRRDCVDDPTAPTPDPTYGLLGPDQTAWLLAGLRASEATFKLVACGSRWTRHGSTDSWDSFLPARDALFDQIRSVEGIVLLSGDIHETDLRLLPRSGGYDLPEITSSPLGRDASFCGFGDSERRFCFDATSSYVLLEADTSIADPTLRATVHDVRGDEVFEWVIRHSELK